MRIYIPHISWEGNFGRYFEEAFGSVGVEVYYSSQKEHSISLINKLHLNSISYIDRFERKRQIEGLNKRVLQECLQYKPDVFYVFNESMLTPFTISTIKDECKCLMVNFVGDDPWDSVRWVADYPHSLKYFDIIITGDPVWNNNIRKVSPKAKILWDCGGYDDRLFTPVEERELSSEDHARFDCQLAFTGSSYGVKAEGAYRSDILSHLTKYDLRIWGGDNWAYRSKFNPQLKNMIKGERLSYGDLRKLYSLAGVFVNLPAPQITYGFQPRVFEIAGCKGFQIVDNRQLLRYLFDDNELIVFDTINELKDQIDYFLYHESDRGQIAGKFHLKVSSNFTWIHWAQRMLTIIENASGVENLDILMRTGDTDEISESLKSYCGL